MVVDVDWTGNNKTVYSILGASNHSETERSDFDFYATDPKAVSYLLEHEQFSNHIWECACGTGNLSIELEKYGYDVLSTDLIYRGYGERERVDFLKCNRAFDGDIITNPPYKYATEFVLKALELTNRKVAMFLKIQFLETKKRWEQLFKEFPPKKVCVFVKRINCFKNDDRKDRGSAVCYAWFIWDKEYDGKTVVEWICNL